MPKQQQPTTKEEWQQRLEPLVKQNWQAVVMLAARAALRSLPLIVDGNAQWRLSKADERKTAALAVCLAVRLAWYNQSKTAISFSVSDSVSVTAPAFAYAAAYADTPTVAAAYAATAAYAAIDEAPDVYDANDHDLLSLERGQLIRTQPLWHDGIPESFKHRIENFSIALTNAGLADFAVEYQWWLSGNVEKLDQQPLDKYAARWEEWSNANTPVEESKQNAQFADPETTESEQENNDAVTEQEPAENDATNSSDAVYQFAPGARIHHETVATKDHLNRTQTAEALSQWLTEKDNTGHLALGLFGDWGAGKSTFVELLRQKLNINLRPDHLFDRIGRFWKGGGNTSLIGSVSESDNSVDFIYGEFNAWHYEHSDNIQAGVAQEAVAGLTYGMPYVSKWWLTLKFSAKAHTARLAGVALLAILLATLPFLNVNIAQLDLLPEGLNELLKANKWPLAIVSLIGLIGLVGTQYKKLIAHPLAEELNTYLRLPHFGKHMGMIPVMREQLGLLARLRLKRKASQKTLRYLFVVDDLDRCSSEGVVKTLEAIKLVMDLDNVVVLIAIDQRIALASLAEHYSSRSECLNDSPFDIARDYLGKIIHVPITLEEPADEEIDAFLDNYLWVGGDNIEVADALSVAHSQGQIAAQTTDVQSPSIASSVDSSPDPGIEPEPKSETKIVTENNKAQQLKGLSHLQKALFKQWTQKLKLRNPRQLKRLSNTYALLRLRYKNEDSEILAFDAYSTSAKGNHPRLLMLLSLEYINGLPAKRRKILLATIQGESKAEGSELSGVDLELWNDLHEALKDLEIIETAYHQVKNFVLPAIDEPISRAAK